MRIDNTPRASSAVADSGQSAVVTPYNAPQPADFRQVMNSISGNSGNTANPGNTAAGATPAGATSTVTPSTPAIGGTASTPSTGPVPGQPAASTPMAQAVASLADGMDTLAHVMASMQQSPATNGASVTGLAVPNAALQSASQAYGAALAAAGVPSAITGATPTASSASAGAIASLAAPVSGNPPVTQPFGPTALAMEPSYDGYSHFHTGIDLGVPSGTQVHAAAAGTVISAGWDSGGFGNCVVVDHGNGLRTLYGHLSHIDVAKGQQVTAGQELGLSGSTGNSSGPHLHFGVQQGGTWVDPTPYIQAQTSASGTDAVPAPGAVAMAVQQVGGGSAAPAATESASASLPTLITRIAHQVGISPALLSAVVQTESAGNPHAVSSAGAKGLTQLMDATAQTYGVTDPFDPVQNLTGGARYLRDLLQRYHGDTHLAVAAYNAGPGAVDQYGGVPPYAETQQYVTRVLSLAGGA